MAYIKNEEGSTKAAGIGDSSMSSIRITSISSISITLRVVVALNRLSNRPRSNLSRLRFL